MSNPLFEMFGKNAATPNPLQNMTNMMNQFNQFRNTVQGDPKQQVMNLLTSGKMSQEQFNQLQKMASQLQKMMAGKK